MCVGEILITMLSVNLSTCISEPAETVVQAWQHGWADGSALSLVVWTLKREVRAFGGCLGMHRR